MAYRDYIHCFKCDCKLVYDGYDNIRQSLDDAYGDPGAPETGMWKVTPKFLCPVCQKEKDDIEAEMIGLLNELANIYGCVNDQCDCAGCRARAAIARAKGGRK